MAPHDEHDVDKAMDRRRFLTSLGGAALLASSAGLAGCARALEWSSGQDSAVSKTVRDAASKEGSVEETQGLKAEDIRAGSHLAAVTGDSPEANVRRAIEQLGGIGRFVKRGANVVVSPNVLVGRQPEFAVTTNPIVVATVIKMCREAGARDVVVINRPTSEARQAYDVSGIGDAAKQAGGRVKIVTDRNLQNTAIPQGRLLTSWPLVSDVFEADAFINLPIAKHHGFAGLTMGMKNLMGIMGGIRGAIHVDFDQKIVDLNTLVKPHLVVLDATRMLMRNGPTGGDLEDVKNERTIVAGTNQISLDSYGTTLFGMKPTDIGYLVNAGDQGLGEIDISRLTVDKVRL